MKIAPSDTQVMYASRGDILYRTGDGGATDWTTQTAIGGGTINSIAIHPTDANKVAVATGAGERVQVSNDGGLTWNSYLLNLPSFSGLAVIWDDNGADALYVGMSYGVRSRSHIAVDLLVRRLAGRDRRVVALLATLVCLTYSVMMLSGAVLFVWGLYKMGHDARDIPVPKWLLTAMLPIGFALLTLRFTELGIQIWRGSIRSLGMSERV